MRHTALIAIMLLLTACMSGGEPEFYVIRVVDSETGRGVPLVELTLPNQVKYWTDSAGVAAFNEPSLFGREVFITVESDGYEYTEETVFGKGAIVRFDPGSVDELQIHRTMVAERLYRLTGEGIYRDSAMAALPVPMEEPLLNAEVLGQDTVVGSIYRSEIFWIWGDTIGPAYFNSRVSAATSSLDDDPAVAVNYHYFTDSEGRAKQMLPLPGGGLVWIEGMITMMDLDGNQRLVASYTRQDGLQFPEECGLALFDDAAEIFRPWVQMPCTRHHRSSHPALHDGYWYFYPSLRVPNDWKAIQDTSQWEERKVQLPPSIDRILLNQRISVIAWNEFRKKWIALLENFGDVYYAEANQPEGPYSEAVRIIVHEEYNLYNVATHTFFNQEGGQIIYIEGTYTDSFTNAPMQTPRYNYNQVMYRLDLDHPGLKIAQH